MPSREARDFPLLERAIIVSILSILSSSRGVGMEEKLDAVIVGDRAGRLDLVANDLPRVASSAFSFVLLVVTLRTI